MLNGSRRLWRAAGPVRFVTRRLNTSSNVQYSLEGPATHPASTARGAPSSRLAAWAPRSARTLALALEHLQESVAARPGAFCLQRSTAAIFYF